MLNNAAGDDPKGRGNRIINDHSSGAHVQPQSIGEDKFGTKHRVGDDDPMDKEFMDHDGQMAGASETAGKPSAIDKMFGNKKSDIKRAFRQTALVKDLRMHKEKEKKRRSMLIYGTTDMKNTLFERSSQEKKNKSGKPHKVADTN